jgi:hypothetical protein
MDGGSSFVTLEAFKLVSDHSALSMLGTALLGTEFRPDIPVSCP